MKTQKPWTPEKRDTNQFLDLIAQLKANQRFKHELEIQITAQKQLIKIMSFPIIAYYLGLLIAPITVLQKILERKISRSQARQTLDTYEKQEKIYHKNILTLENDLEGTLEICNENFTSMVNMIQDLANKDEDCEDAHVLLAKMRQEPPDNKLDRLQLFLSMESCWIRFRK